MTKSIPVTIPRDTICEEYLTQQMSCADLVRLHHIGIKVVIKHLRYFNIPIRNQSEACKTQLSRTKNKVWHTGRTHTEATRIKLKNRPKIFGLHCSDETKKKLSIINVGNNYMRKAIDKGFKYTPKTIEKMRVAALNRPPISLATRMKMSQASKGHKRHTPGQIAIIKANMLGKQYCKGRIVSDQENIKRSFAIKRAYENDPNYRAGLRLCHLGERNPQWLGGLSFIPYTAEFNREIREFIKTRDMHQCQLCGVPECECTRKLATHHINYNKNDSKPSNLIALCTSCNVKVNKDRVYWTQYFCNLLNNRQTKSAVYG